MKEDERRKQGESRRKRNIDRRRANYGKGPDGTDRRRNRGDRRRFLGDRRSNKKREDSGQDATLYELKADEHESLEDLLRRLKEKNS